MTMRCAALTLMIVMASSFATALPPSPPTIDSPGVGTVEAAPDYVEFWLHATGPGKTLSESAEAVQAFDPALRKELESRKIVPASLDFSNLAIPRASTNATFRSAKLRFSAVAFKSNEDGPKQFAKLCDDILAVGAAIPGITVEGPTLGVENTKPIEQAAIALATEKAYAPAEAIATAMKTQIVGIQSASILSVVWNQDPNSKAPQPDIRRLTCTAKVRIWYFYPTPVGGG